MKRYLIFSCDNYYPSGGIDDFKCDLDSKEEVVECIREYSFQESDNIYILDTKTRMKWHFYKANPYDVEVFMQDSTSFV